jgi:hypothetical protein
MFSPPQLRLRLNSNSTVIIRVGSTEILPEGNLPAKAFIPNPVAEDAPDWVQKP